VQDDARRIPPARPPRFLALPAAGFGLALLGSVGAAAQQPAAPATAPVPAVTAGEEGRTAQQVLIDQAAYWMNRNRADLAREALDRLLKNDPNHAEALLRYGLLEAQAGNADAAQRYLTTLRRAHPDDQTRIQRLSEAIQAGQIKVGDVEQARRLAQAGRFDQALEEYRRAFGGDPVDRFAIEYYETMAGVPSRYEEARTGLDDLAKRSGDPSAELALARIMTYQERYRRDAIRRLERLSRVPSVETEARRTWRQALVWLQAGRDDRALFSAYLERYPGDTELEERGRTLRPPTSAPAARAVAPTGPDRATQARIDGFKALDRGDLRQAESLFRTTLGTRSGDADALGGMGIIRLRQERFADAEQLLKQAIDRSSASGKARWADAYNSARFFAGMEQATAAREEGDLRRAEQIARELIRRRHPDDYLARNLLGDVLLARGDADAAEREYLRVVEARPADTAARLGLFNVYVAQGRRQDALRLAEAMDAETRGQVEGIDRVRAQVLRNKALELEKLGEIEEAYLAFQDAIVADPADPWLRLDFARFMVDRGEMVEARNMVDGLVDSDYATPASLHAAAIFYNEQLRYGDAVLTLDRIPRTALTAEMTALRDRAQFQLEVERAKAVAEAGAVDEAVRILESLHRMHPQTTEYNGIVASALADVGQTGRALQLVRRRIIRAGNDVGPKTYLQYASVLLQAGHEAEAAAYIRQLEQRPDLSRADRADLAGLHTALAIHQADRARDRGAFADAYDILYPHLAERPNDPALLMALARLYASGKRPDAAQRVYDAVLIQDPRNLDAVRGAVGASIEGGDTTRARMLIDHALAYHPREPRLYYLMGQVARIEGDTDTAIRALETAKVLRDEQIQMVASAVDRLVPDLPPNPFRTGEVRPGLQRLLPASVRAPMPTEAPADVNPFAGSSPGYMPLSPIPAARSAPPAAPDPRALVPDSRGPDPVSTRPRAVPNAVPTIPADAINPFGPNQSDLRPQRGAGQTLHGGTGAGEGDRLRSTAAFSSPPKPTPPPWTRGQTAAAGSPALLVPPKPVPPPGAAAAAAIRPAAIPAEPDFSGALLMGSDEGVQMPAPAPRPSVPTDRRPTRAALLAAAPPPKPADPPPPAPVTVEATAPPPNPTAGPRGAALADGTYEIASADSAYVAPGATGTQIAQASGYYSTGYYGGGAPQAGGYPAGGYQGGYRPGTSSRGFGNFYYVPPFLDPAVQPRQEPDNLTRDIEKSLREIRRTTAPSMKGGIQIRGRNGDSGLARLNVVEAPAEASFSPMEFGTLTVKATPVMLDSGSVGSEASDQRRFGTNALGQSAAPAVPVPPGVFVPVFAPAVDPGSQTDAGLGVSLDYKIDDFAIDVGVTPLGFTSTSFVGGVSYAPKLTRDFGLEVKMEQRALTDSVLAYAGTRDERTGENWGGVTRTGIRGDFTFDDGLLGAYIGGGMYQLQGESVADNHMFETGFGTYYRVMRGTNDELKIGINLTYLSYENNLRHFTFGHGGYFSPQSYLALSLPIEYEKRTERVRYVVGGAIGIQDWSEDRARYFPNNAGLQSDLEALAASDPTIEAFHQGQSQTGVGFNLHGQLEYQISPTLSVGGAASFDKAADWFEASALVYMKHLFTVE